MKNFIKTVAFMASISCPSLYAAQAAAPVTPIMLAPRGEFMEKICTTLVNNVVSPSFESPELDTVFSAMQTHFISSNREIEASAVEHIAGINEASKFSSRIGMFLALFVKGHIETLWDSRHRPIPFPVFYKFIATGYFAELSMWYNNHVAKHPELIPAGSLQRTKHEVVQGVFIRLVIQHKALLKSDVHIPHGADDVAPAAPASAASGSSNTASH